MMRQAITKKGFLATSTKKGSRMATTAIDTRVESIARMYSYQFSTTGRTKEIQNQSQGGYAFSRILFSSSSLSLQQHQQLKLTMTNSFANEGSVRLFSTNTKDDEKAKDETEEQDIEEPTKKSKEGESFEDTINRLKGDNKDSSEESSFGFDKDNELHRSFADKLSNFRSALSDTWKELLNAGSARDINKKIHDAHPSSNPENANYDDDDAAADKYEGSTAIMVIDEDEHLSAWERMERRLRDAPIIKNILEQSEHIYEKSGAAKAKEKIDDIKHDAQEAWETSQNPWVYRISSVYDTITAESEYALAVKELRQLDPEFTLEGWKHDVVHHTIPNIMNLFLQGRIKELKPWLGEAVYNRIAAEVRARKKDGVQIDTNILGIMNSEILACQQDEFEKGSPIILLHFMCQQIHCVRKKEDNSIVEGGEDDIRANSYVVAFQREYEEEKGELNWKIVDFRFNGAMAYL